MLSVLLAASLAQVLPPKQDEVDAAIKRGAEWLLMKANEGLPGPAIDTPGGLSYDGFVLYTLHHAGVDKENPQLRMLAERVAAAKIHRTYTAATVAMALRSHDPVKYKEKIFECGQYLVDTMCENGQWGYGVEYGVPRPKFKESSGTAVRTRIKRSGSVAAPPPGDNSNTQYAALGLFSCWLAGFDIEGGTIDRAIKWWEGSQLPDGSWDYGEQGGKVKSKEGGFGSMTAGGASSVIMLRRIKGDTLKPSSAGKAINWLAANFTVTENPGGPVDRKRFHFYYLYALERLGDLYPTEKFGKHLWYALGADWLLKNQKGGVWLGPLPGMEIADTCFAILFLDRSMKVATEGSKK